MGIKYQSIEGSGLSTGIFQAKESFKRCQSVFSEFQTLGTVRPEPRLTSEPDRIQEPAVCVLFHTGTSPLLAEGFNFIKIGRSTGNTKWKGLSEVASRRPRPRAKNLWPWSTGVSAGTSTRDGQTVLNLEKPVFSQVEFQTAFYVMESSCLSRRLSTNHSTVCW